MSNFPGGTPEIAPSDQTIASVAAIVEGESSEAPVVHRQIDKVAVAVGTAVTAPIDTTRIIGWSDRQWQGWQDPYA